VWIGLGSHKKSVIFKIKFKMENITSLSQFALLLGAMAPIRQMHFDEAKANHHKDGP
jgi:hypothetical protein